jgi:hypothetical protein
MREALMAFGIGIALSSLGIILWASFVMAAVERSEDMFDDSTSGWTWDPDPFYEDTFDRQRDSFSLIRLAGVVALVVGALLAFYGYSLSEGRPFEDSMVAREIVPNDGRPHYCESCGQSYGPGSEWCGVCGRKLK